MPTLEGQPSSTRQRIRTENVEMIDPIEELLTQDLFDEAQLEQEHGSGLKYEKAQRELLTQTVDFNIKTLADMLASDQIDTNPKYQRRLRWDHKRQAALIESFLMNVPMPPIFLAEEEYGYYSVIDGQQRLRTIRSFFADSLTLVGLEVFDELNGLKRSQLEPSLKRILDVRPTMRCIIIQKQSDPGIKYEVFERLNTGGVRLNAQEIRNSAYRGRLNDLILELAESKDFRVALRIKNELKSVIVQHMRDCELVLRFIALRDTWHDYSGSMQSTLNTYMIQNRNCNDDVLVGNRGAFQDTLAEAHEIFGETLFYRYDVKKMNWRHQIVAAMYDAQMLSVHHGMKHGLTKKKGSPVDRLEKLFIKDSEFERAILEATNTPSRLKYRVAKLIEILYQE